MRDLIGESPAIERVRAQVTRLLQQLAQARRPPAVLLEGETGTGKGLIARWLHRGGPRAAGPLVGINCAAIPETLLEAELFGFERGAFTDARQAKAGLFQAAHHGILFLDEIGLLPLALQGKLLQALEEGAIRRLGSTRGTAVDVWIIAASNEDLAAAVRAGRLRGDLYHRLAGVPLRLPPLRERGEDIGLLAEQFLRQACVDYGRAPMQLGADALRALQRYAWPGNVRELANVIERAVLLSEGLEVTEAALGLPLPGAHNGAAQGADAEESLRGTVDRVERAQVLKALDESGWNISAAADRLQMPRNTFRYRMLRYGLRSPVGPVRRRRGGDPEDPGSRAPGVESSRAGAPAVGRREQRQVVWLYAGLGELGEAASASIGRALDVLVEKVESFGGHVEEIGEGGIVAVFGLAPIEDAPRRAVQAAVAMARARDRGVALVDRPLPLALAIHAAAGVFDDSKGGRQLTAASWREGREALAALAAGAGGNEIVATAPAARAVERWFHIEAVPGPAGAAQGPVYVVRGSRASGFEAGAHHRPSLFVGREREMGLLREQVARLAGGRGQVIGLVGEPGGGKSRLLHEFRQHLGGQRVSYLEGRCVSHGAGIPYLPVLDLLRRAWGLDDTDRPEVVTAAVRRHLEAAGLDPEELAPYLLRLFGLTSGTAPLEILSPEAIKRRTFDVVRQLILQREGPVVLAVEDLHWVDKTSEDLFTSVVDSTPGAPLLFLSTYRPGYCPPWIDRSYVSQLALAPLSAADSRSVVQSILPASSSSEGVIEGLVARSQGNPFFLEELALAVAQQDAPDLDGTVPQTIGEVLTARIDRLPDPLRQVLQTAAVLGHEVPLRVLEAMQGTPKNLAGHLAKLVRQEFLHEQAGAAGRVYGFKHALIQEVAYAGLSKPERLALHAAAGRAIERLYSDRLEEMMDRLAYHFGKTDETLKAVTYLTSFAEQATESYALTEAVTALEEALLHADRLPTVRERDHHVLTTVNHMVTPLMLLGRLAETRDLLLRYDNRVERLNDPMISGRYYVWCAATADHLGDRDHALASANRAIIEATRAGDAPTLCTAHVVLSHGNLWAGEFRSGVENARLALQGNAQQGEILWNGMAHWIRAWHHMLLGEFLAAGEAGKNVGGVGETSGDRRLQSYGACIAGWIAILSGDLAVGIEALELAATLAPDPLALAVVLSILGEGHAEAGDSDRAKHHLERALALVRQFHMPQMECWTLCRLNTAYLQEGQGAEAHELASKALLLAQTAAFPLGEGLAHRAIGRSSAVGGPSGETSRSLDVALGIFSRLESRYEMGRTHLDLAGEARRLGDQEGLATHLNAARNVFQSLSLPRWVARTGGSSTE